MVRMQGSWTRPWETFENGYFKGYIVRYFEAFEIGIDSFFLTMMYFKFEFEK